MVYGPTHRSEFKSAHFRFECKFLQLLVTKVYTYSNTIDLEGVLLTRHGISQRLQEHIPLTVEIVSATICKTFPTRYNNHTRSSRLLYTLLYNYVKYDSVDLEI